MSDVLIIAEAGVNHNGDVALAHRLVDAAADAGADIVKFQTFRSGQLVSRHAPLAEYQQRNLGETLTQDEMLKRLELDRAAHEELAGQAARRGIEFLSTGFDFDSLKMLAELGPRRYKIPSGEITNLPYLRWIGRQRMPVILSTGMATLDEVKSALEVLTQAGASRDDIVLLHCTTEYPAPIEEVNLRAMVSMREVFGVKVGYSDHTPGIEIPVAAVALGAVVIEKHLTLDRSLPGPDHKASLEPAEFSQMVRAIRNTESALGDGCKRPCASEMKNLTVARRSIVAARAIRAGEVFTEDNLTTKRPGTGLSPMRWDEIIGLCAPRNFDMDEAISL